MRHRTPRRFSVLGSASLALALGSTLLPTPLLASDCVTAWHDCRGEADRAFFRNEVGIIRYSLLLDGCDWGYFRCSDSKQKNNGK